MHKRQLIFVVLMALASGTAHATPPPSPSLAPVLWRVVMVSGIAVIASSGAVIAAAQTQTPTPWKPEHKRIGVAVVAGVGFALALGAASAGYALEE